MSEGPRSSRWERFTWPVLACLSLGLMPFVPEPHIWGKLRWVLGGAKGMAPMDWFDLVLHGAPWLWLAYTAVQELVRSIPGRPDSSGSRWR